MDNELKPVKVGHFVFDAEPRTRLWGLINPEECGYSYLVTTREPVKYGSRQSRILYIGSGGETDNPDYLSVRALQSFAGALAWLCYPGREDSELVQSYEGPFELHIVPCPKGVAPRELEGDLLREFENTYEGRPAFNKKPVHRTAGLVDQARSIVSHFKSRDTEPAVGKESGAV